MGVARPSQASASFHPVQMMVIQVYESFVSIAGEWLSACHHIGLESINRTSIYFLQSTSVLCDVIVFLSIYDVIQSPQFLGNRWRMRKQSIPGPSSEEVRPGIEDEIISACGSNSKSKALTQR